MFLPSLLHLPEKKRPIPLPRAEKARVPDPQVQKLIEEIAPFYKPEAIEEFRDKVRRAFDKKKVQVIEKKKALKNRVKSFEIYTMFYRKDPRKLFVQCFTVSETSGFNQINCTQNRFNSTLALTKIKYTLSVSILCLKCTAKTVHKYT